ncbi:hypothetical protein RMR16_024970 (plasmid) [Agrobacterium sp. rho-13.3]|uniref:hypothetical protein n=1 Tax=Agrobacterium sp. rho-13.3 TaxID=3072980 RepID=UPI002A1669B3|nr:hypothetical protein [Agrobacterium sp. rho-13.3]MDX8310205.1 hypothetical protein [Agrobacterium sp. rho-13.3]
MKAFQSRTEVLVNDLAAAVSLLKDKPGLIVNEIQTLVERDFHIEFAMIVKGNARLALVKPISGILKDLFDDKGEGTCYRLTSASDVAGVEFKVVRQGVLAGGPSFDVVETVKLFLNRIPSRSFSEDVRSFNAPCPDWQPQPASFDPMNAVARSSSDSRGQL